MSSVGICQVQGSPGAFVYCEPDARTGVVQLIMQTSGRCVIGQNGRETTLVPGDFALLDTRLAYQLTFGTRFHCLVLEIPAELIPVRPGELRSMIARRVPGHTGIGKLVGQFLGGVAQQVLDCDLRAGHDLASAMINLVVAALQQTAAQQAPPVDTSRQSLLQRVKAYIEARLDEPELAPAEIARANHISLRYLQKIFEAEGTTVSDWVRRRRLERCRIELIDPRHDSAPIGAIAARWGFIDSSYFSRIFKATYGATPREFRSGALLTQR
ncbi:helix-turn-helix domain-containing protein [Nocardia farcinica]|nr:helix-turn-helix domain-containing protein [Nocardia farcinica]MBF6535978.1 helix-turn-helix domain-containing protein [Nocardia farcinica]